MSESGMQFSVSRSSGSGDWLGHKMSQFGVETVEGNITNAIAMVLGG